MNRWDGKFVIGLTGNIGTGKSVVRRMLEHLGAYGIDADALAHRVIEKGAPGYKPIVRQFGVFILKPDGEINRARLGRIVFSDPEALAALEQIVHPYVSKVIDLIISRSKHKVIVIEAIKLLEGNLAKNCSSIWVTYTHPETQLDRLVNRRKMKVSDAKRRIASQPPQREKISAADVVIHNVSTFEDTWKRVVAAWRKVVPTGSAPAARTMLSQRMAEFDLEPGKPSHANEIADFYNRHSKAGTVMDRLTIMEAFGEKAFLLLRKKKKLVGVVGWQVENLVLRTIDLLFDPDILIRQGLPLMIKQIEADAKDLQCEASLVFLPVAMSNQQQLWDNLGYRKLAEIEELKIPAWIEAATESMPPGSNLFFKQLRQDRILRPI